MPYIYSDEGATELLLKPASKMDRDTGHLEASRPFHRWTDSFRAKKHRRVQPVQPVQLLEKYVQGLEVDGVAVEAYGRAPYGDKSSEQLSDAVTGNLSFLGPVTTASVTVTSINGVRSRTNTQSTSHLGPPRSGNRISMDSVWSRLGPFPDKAAFDRAVKRRQVLCEVFQTEKDYIQGLQALTDILSMFLSRPEIYYNLVRIRKIHEEFLHELRRVTPCSETARTVPASLLKRMGALEFPRVGIRNTKSGRGRSASIVAFQEATAGPTEARLVAEEIENLATLTDSRCHVGSDGHSQSALFSAYEEFCRHYDLLTEDMDMLRQSLPNWPIYEQGIEALSKSVASKDCHQRNASQSMTLNDLLIKPVQRLCKYPLLLQDLLRCTPITDCDDESHNRIRAILDGFRLIVARVNSVTGNPIMRDRIQKTILLQGKLTFARNSPITDLFAQLGPLTQCGLLHVTYETPNRIIREYMACTLFSAYFVLAKLRKDGRKMQAVAVLYITDVRIDAVDIEDGDACDGSLSTWKVRFPVDDFDYELILSASSATEEIQWKSEILKLSAALTEAARTRPLEPRRYSFLDLNLRGLPRSEATLPLTRTLSADSLPPPRSRPRQRIAFVRANTSHQAGETLSRSATKLASKSQDRIRLERCISDVCTQDVLPYRGTILASSNFFSRTTSIMRRFTSQAEIVRNSLSLDLGRRGLRADVGSASGNDDEGKGGRVSRDGRGSESKCDSYVEQALKSVTEESVDENKRASDIPALALSLVPRKWSSFPGSLFTAFSLGWRKRSRSRLSTEM